MARSSKEVGLALVVLATAVVLLVVYFGDGRGRVDEPVVDPGGGRAPDVGAVGWELGSDLAVAHDEGSDAREPELEDEVGSTGTPTAFTPWRPTRDEVLELAPEYFCVRPEQRESMLRRTFGRLITLDDLDGARQLFGPDLDPTQLAILVGEALPFDDELLRIGEQYCDELDHARRDIFARGAYQLIEHEVGETPQPGGSGVSSVTFPGFSFRYRLDADEYPDLRQRTEEAEDAQERRERHLRAVLDGL